MATKAEIFRYRMERSGPKKSKRPPRPRRDVPVDTSLPGISATDRKAGGGATARRNKSKSAGKSAVYALEDSATGKPSRRSTRKSANRANPAGAKRRAYAAKRTWRNGGRSRR